MWRRAVVLTTALVLLVSCESGSPTEDGVLPPRPMSSASQADSRLIYLIGTMSGSGDWRGEDAFEGAEVAIHSLNRSVDEGRPMFELVTLDDEGDHERATELLLQAASEERAVGIVYAGPPDALPPAERALTLAGIPAILCFGDLYSAQLLRPHIFQASPSFLWQARVLASYLTGDRGYSRLGLMVESSMTGDTARKAFAAALEGTGKGRAFVQPYTHDQNLVPAVRALLKKRVSAIIVEGSPAILPEVSDVLDDLGAGYRTRTEARRGTRPQLASFDLGINPTSGASVPDGTVAADSYARGTHLLPIPNFEAFRRRFNAWWDGDEPLGWEQRAFDAVGMIGWAAQRTPSGADIALTLERADRLRFGGLDVTFGPDDHTAIDQTAVGLWVRPKLRFGHLAAGGLQWLPLARGFSIDGDRTSVLNRDWRYLFRNPPPADAPAPPLGRMRFAVTTPRSDPIH